MEDVELLQTAKDLIVDLIENPPQNQSPWGLVGSSPPANNRLQLAETILRYLEVANNLR